MMLCRCTPRCTPAWRFGFHLPGWAGQVLQWQSQHLNWINAAQLEVPYWQASGYEFCFYCDTLLVIDQKLACTSDFFCLCYILQLLLVTVTRSWACKSQWAKAILCIMNNNITKINRRGEKHKGKITPNTLMINTTCEQFQIQFQFYLDYCHFVFFLCQKMFHIPKSGLFFFLIHSSCSNGKC